MVARAAPTPGRMMRSAAATSSGVRDEPAREPEVLERVQHARRVAGAVVDDVDHARPRVANALTVGPFRSIRVAGSFRSTLVMRSPGPPLRRSRARRRACAPAAALLASSRWPVACRRRRLPPRRRRPPGSPGVPVMGQSRLTADQLVAYYQRNDPATLPYRAHRCDAGAARASCSSTEGNRYNVRGDIAFAQSIVETAWFNFPDYGHGAPDGQQLRRHRRVRLVRQRLPVHSALNGVRAPDPAAAQLRRRQLARRPTIPDPPVPELWGSTPRPRRTTSTTTSPRATRRSGTTWATATGRPRPNYATVVLARLQPDAHLQRAARLSARPTACSSDR